ncbi:MAG TPA: Hsp20/alpha crystallin family protein [Gemmatales bacterium]|nr:Hsp20/alpha crystallin family protein [Gemmatales bacterium]
MSTCLTNSPVHAVSKTNSPMFTPRVDEWETENEYFFHADMPGVKPGDINLQFENGHLKLSGKVQVRERNLNKLTAEYAVGDFERQFAINDEVDVNKISADYKNGVLTVKLPKREEVKPRKIEITI